MNKNIRCLTMKKNFTLIEVMIVITIIATVVALIVLPFVKHYKSDPAYSDTQTETIKKKKLCKEK